MSDPTKAVFLSYASQDAEAAKRIAAALRATGIEVWFDKNELVGGDTWDHKIRKQIQSCALFIPIISSNTQARAEGYFRLEWRLADQRTHLMAKGRPFLLPVVIDDTRDVDAQVPDSFTEVQWTSLPGGETAQAFRARVKKLLGEETAGAALRSDLGKSSGPNAAPAASPATRSWLIPVLISAAAVVTFALWQPWKTSPSTSTPTPVVSIPAAVPTASLSPLALPALAQSRGLAILPFENFDGPEQDYFAAGITEEVTQHLSKSSELRVMSRQAVARFRGGAADLPAMTSELGIRALLTGSVRRSGDVVRISVQLLVAPSGETLWSEQYERDAKDIFGVQTDVAVRVARALQASLAPAERAMIERPPTGNTEAYELYLKSRTVSHPEAIALLKQAVALDPKFALAHSSLSRRYQFHGYTTGRDDFNRALESARVAVALDPQLARAHHALANALNLLGRIDEARLAMQRSIELDPNLSGAMNDLSILESMAGRMDQSLYWAKRAFRFAPNIANSHYHVAAPLMILDEAAAERWLQAALRRFPADDRTGIYRLHGQLAMIETMQGRTASALERIRKENEVRPKNPETLRILTEVAFAADAPDAPALLDGALKIGAGARFGFWAYTPRTMRAFLWLKSGDRENALALLDAALEENRLAIAGGDRSCWPPHENAALHLMRGDRASAVDWLERAAAAGFTDTALLKVDPILAPLTEEPRIMKLVERINRDLQEMKSRVDLSDLDELAATFSPVTHK